MTGYNIEEAIQDNWREISLADEEIPEGATEPICWQNKHTNDYLAIIRHDDEECWAFGSDGSFIYVDYDFEKIQSRAKDYLATTRKPGPMVVG